MVDMWIKKIVPFKDGNNAFVRVEGELAMPLEPFREVFDNDRVEVELKKTREITPDETIIVTRHKGLVEWLAKRGITGRVIEHIEDPEQYKNKRIIGVFPIHLAHKLIENNELIQVVLPTIPPELRGQELTADKMEELGVKMYRIKKLELEEV